MKTRLSRLLTFGLIVFMTLNVFSCGEDNPLPIFEDDILLVAANLNPADFASEINNPYFTLLTGDIHIYEGVDEDGVEERVVSRVTFETKTILGVNCVVVLVKEYSDGSLIEETRDWYAQDKKGNVWYFGEDVKDIEDGQVYSTFGSWEAGVNGAKPGIIMLANPQPGRKYHQEVAVGIAEDQAEVVSLNNTVTVPYGTFQNCLKTKETNPLDPGFEEFKYYAPDVGFIKAEPAAGGVEELAEITDMVDRALLNAGNINPVMFVEGVDNPYFPLTPGKVYTYSGLNDEDLTVTVISEVTTETRVILGVVCTVVHEQEFEDGELIEDTYDWYAQDVEGNVWYFGEDTKSIEDGVVVGTGGSWEAGVNEAVPGIIMLANPIPGMKYRQEVYEGEAEDRAEVSSLNNTVTVPFGTFENCIKILASTPLEVGVLEAKYYAPGTGFIKGEDQTSSEFEALENISN